MTLELLTVLNLLAQREGQFKSPLSFIKARVQGSVMDPYRSLSSKTHLTYISHLVSSPAKTSVLRKEWLLAGINIDKLVELLYEVLINCSLEMVPI